MDVTILKFLDFLFFTVHSVFILFNVFGWILPRWRRMHLVALMITAFSWFGLGIWFGWGYCLCTDWHWQVREILGYQDMSSSYIHFLILKVTGANLSIDFVDACTLIIFLSAFIISTFLNVKKWIRK